MFNCEQPYCRAKFNLKRLVLETDYNYCIENRTNTLDINTMFQIAAICNI